MVVDKCWVVILLVLFVNGATALETGSGKRIFRSADVHPEDYPTVQAVLSMGQELNKSSGGTLSIQVFHSGLLGDESPLLDLVRSGELDMNRVSAQAFDALSSQMSLLSLPYLFRDTDHLHKVIDGPIGQELLDSLLVKGLVGLAFYDAGTRSVYSSKGPLQKLEDFKDLQIRIQPSSQSSVMFELLKAKPVRLPFAQVFRALNNHLVEAAENNLPSFSTAEHYRIAPYYSLTRHTMTPDVLVMSKRTWDKLSRSEQVLVRKSARNSVILMRDMWQQREERVEAMLKLAGVKFTNISKEELARLALATQPVYARFAGDAQQQDLIKRIRAVK